jgi:phospholipase/carboxylesterase
VGEPVERRFVQELARYYDLYVPEGDGPFPLVVAMHGYGGDKASMMRLARRIAGDEAFAIASLQGPFQHVVAPEDRTQPLKYGFGWVTNFKPDESIAMHADAVRLLLDDVGSEARVDASRAFFMGFSQAVGVLLRFAFTHPALVRGAVAMCGGIPGDWNEEGKYREGDFDVLFVAGARDEFYDADRSRASAHALERRARAVEYRLFDAGHEVPREAYPVIAEWLRAR